MCTAHCWKGLVNILSENLISLFQHLMLLNTKMTFTNLPKPHPSNSWNHAHYFGLQHLVQHFLFTVITSQQVHEFTKVHSKACRQLTRKAVHLFWIIFNKQTPLVPQLAKRLAHLGKPSETKMSLPSSFSPRLLQNLDCQLMLPLKAKLGRDVFHFPLRGLLVIYTLAVFLAQHISSCLHSFFAVDVFKTAVILKLYFTNSHCLYILLDLICTLQLTVYRNAT